MSALRVAKTNAIKIEKAKWCGLGATLVPRKLAEEIEIDEDLTFSEDRFFGFISWLKGYPVLVLKVGNEHPCIDINLSKGDNYNIYIRMGIKDYLRGLTKKVVWHDIWPCYEDTLAHTLRRFIGSLAFRKYSFHVALDLSSIALTVYTLHSYLGVPLGYALAMLIGSMLLKFKKGIDVVSSLKAFFKFNVFSIAALATFLPLYFKYRELLSKAFNAYKEFEYPFNSH